MSRSRHFAEEEWYTNSPTALILTLYIPFRGERGFIGGCYSMYALFGYHFQTPHTRNSPQSFFERTRFASSFKDGTILLELRFCCENLCLDHNSTIDKSMSMVTITPVTRKINNKMRI